MKYHKQNACVKKAIYCQANPTFVDLIEANRALTLLGARGLTKVASSLNEKPSQMDGCVLTF
jgi:hypothetical protein